MINTICKQGELLQLNNDINIFDNESKIKRIAKELYEIPSNEHVEEAFEATKELMDTLQLQSQNREDKIQLAKKRMQSGYYNRKDVLAKIAKKLLDEFDLE